MQFTEWACGGPDIIRDAGPVPDGPRLDIRDAVRKRHSVSPMYTAYTWDVKAGDVIEVDHTAPVYFVAQADGEVLPKSPTGWKGIWVITCTKRNPDTRAGFEGAPAAGSQRTDGRWGDGGNQWEGGGKVSGR